VHERHLRSSRFDCLATTRDNGQRFAAERSPKVTQEDQQQRTAFLHLL
jgi:hypothetical protein